ncbi:MAG: aldo/keto reductase [Thermoplasmata archaeon]
MAPDFRPTFPLNHGGPIPSVGLGVYRISPGRQTERSVSHALEVGYRLVDTARLYRNERSVGKVIREGRVNRSDVFVTTKLWNSDHGYERAVRAFGRSQERLGLGPVDLYLIHWPVEGRRTESWRALETLLDEGACRSIGVSNYMVHHLEELLDASSVTPAVNQIELSPYNFRSREGVVDFCQAKGIQVEAYSPLTKGRRLHDPRLAEIGRRHGKTPAQVLLRWGYQHDFVVIPRSSNPSHIAENFDIADFALSDGDMEGLDALDQNLTTSWDPTGAP